MTFIKKSRTNKQNLVKSQRNNHHLKKYYKIKSRKNIGGNMTRIKSRKYIGGELNSTLKNKIMQDYKIPKKLVNVLGKLVDTEEEFFENLKNSGLSYPKNKLPITGDKYWDPEGFFDEYISDEIEEKTYKGLFPLQSRTSPDLKWVYVCGVCPEDQDSCALSETISLMNSLKPDENVNIDDLTIKIKSGCQKKIDYSDINDNIVSAVRQYRNFFINYLYFLPWSVESNETFYLKSLNYGIKLNLFTLAEKDILTNSLSWKLLDCQPCIMYNKTLKKFCIDPFYLNESIEWVSNIYDEENWSSFEEGLETFKSKADRNIDEYITKYNIDNLKQAKPIWWNPAFNKYIDNIYAVIIIFEQNANREIFQKIQFLMTIMKFLLTNYVVMNNDGNRIIEMAPLLNDYMVTSESTKYGCAASIAREIEAKMNKLILLFKTSGLGECYKVYTELDPFSNNELKREYVIQYHQFIDDFFSLIDNEDSQSIIELIKKIFFTNLQDYRLLDSPLFLNAEQAEILGMCTISSSQLLEELTVLMVQNQ